MSNHKPLQNETVIFTGTPKSTEVLTLVEEYGGTPFSAPLIGVEEVINDADETYLKCCHTYDWLIFTSQSAVKAFYQKLVRHHVHVSSIPSNIAAVGTKTAEALRKIGFQVQFIPSTFSADVFVKEFQPSENDTRKLLFLKGNMAGSIIREELPFRVDEWTVYETIFLEKHLPHLIDCIQTHSNVSVLFASPSAVDMFYRQVVPHIGWNGYTICAIGHVTERALIAAGATVDVRPTVYTLAALVEALAKKKGRNNLTQLQFDRHRRLRHTKTLRSMVRETVLQKEDFIYPIFVVEGEDIQHPVQSMPGVYQLSLDYFEKELDELVELGIQSIILFGIPAEKNAVGSSAYANEGIVQRAIRLAKTRYPDLVVIADTCLCQYTDHGHCGVIHEGYVDNDQSLDLLTQTAISQAQAGADIIAPSNMMDGFVAAIRAGLDEAGFEHLPIMSYAVKYASAFYGPFRDAAHSSPQLGDRKTYQMDPANRLEAMREAQSDVDEGADFLIIKPALSYLDIMRDVKNTHPVPLVAYNVSGEYSMVKAAAQNGWINEKEIVLETLTSMKRAGADLIMTYHAKDAAKWLEEK